MKIERLVKMANDIGNFFNSETDKEIAAEGVFIFVGRIPHTGIFRDVLKLDAGGYIITDDNMRTSSAGIFAAGDCRAKQFRQVVTAAGDGANATYSTELYIDELKGQTY